jgi:hypothetical protein
MTDDEEIVPDPPYEPGDVFLDPIRDTRWEVTGVSREYAVTISPEDPDAGETADETAYYPEESVHRKLETGGLVVHPDEPADPIEDGGKYVCEECGESFETERARNGHLSAHQS